MLSRLDAVGHRSLRPVEGAVDPLEVADQTGSPDKALESWLANESSTPTGFLLPVPHAEQDEADDPLAPMKADLKTLAGGCP